MCALRIYDRNARGIRRRRRRRSRSEDKCCRCERLIGLSFTIEWCVCVCVCIAILYVGGAVRQTNKCPRRTTRSTDHTITQRKTIIIIYTTARSIAYKYRYLYLNTCIYECRHDTRVWTYYIYVFICSERASAPNQST